MVRWNQIKNLKGDETMLQGTLDVFSLDEVLGLLSGANKNGVLNITGDRGVGSVSISDGHVVAGSASSAPGAAALSDVVFELLRYEEGSFSFDGAAVAEGEAHDLDAIMTEAHRRLDEWKSIEAVVPSLDHYVSLSASLSASQVTLSESEWAAIVAIGEGASVGVIARRLDLGEFDGSKRIKSLIERSLASLEEGAPTKPEHPVEGSVPVADAREAPAFAAPVFETPEPAPASFADVAAPVIEAPVIEAHVADIAADFSIETVAPDAPAFDDAAGEAFVADADIPPMPEAPAFAAHASESFDTDVPPMPEPPSTFSAEVSDLVPPPPASTFSPDVFDVPAPPAPDVSPSTFGGFDSIDGPGLFEAPVRSEDRASEAFSTDGFDISDLTAGAETDPPMPPPPAPASPGADRTEAALPSFTPPAGFDAKSFASGEDVVAADEEVEAADDGEDEKGGSLLMRYLKSNG